MAAKIPGNPNPNIPPPRAGAARPDAGKPAPRPGEPSAAADGAPGAGGQGPVDEEAHFRLDEHQRQLDELKAHTSPEHVAGMVQGATAALHTSMQAETEKLLKAVREDVDTDKAVVKAIGELVAVIRELIATRQV
jgi:hypothetical protein